MAETDTYWGFYFFLLIKFALGCLYFLLLPGLVVKTWRVSESAVGHVAEETETYSGYPGPR